MSYINANILMHLITFQLNNRCLSKSPDPICLHLTSGSKRLKTYQYNSYIILLNDIDAVCNE